MYYLYTEDGEKIKLPENIITETIKEKFWTNAYAISEECKLKKIYIVNGFRREFGAKVEYEYVDDKRFTHYPSEEELMAFMAKNNILKTGYITIEEGYAIDEDYIED